MIRSGRKYFLDSGTAYERKEVRWFIPRKGEGAVGLYPGQAPVQLMITKLER